jgi:hypothetical protein
VIVGVKLVVCVSVGEKVAVTSGMIFVGVIES